MAPRFQALQLAPRHFKVGSLGPLGRWVGVPWFIWTTAWSIHRHLSNIFWTWRKCLRYSAGEFGRQELGFLGHLLSANGDPRKVQSITEWATPTSGAEVRRCTRVASYYRHFVEGYAEVAAR